MITPQFGPDSAYGPETTLDSNFFAEDPAPSGDKRAATSAHLGTAQDSGQGSVKGSLGAGALTNETGLHPLSQHTTGGTQGAAAAAQPSTKALRSPTLEATPAPSEAAVEAGATLSTVGRYAIKGHLGAGGLGQVYQAWDPVLARSVAVKTVQLNLEPGLRARLDAKILQQARAAGGLKHPNIVTVLDAGVSAQGVYIAMDRLDGRDMGEALARGWRPRPSQTAQIMRLLAEAVAYAHAKGVVHGNIKPTNVFISRDDRPRLLDFGIAQAASQGLGSASDAVISAPNYLAPEQLTEGRADRRTDIHALGVVMYELLALRKAFVGDTADQVIQAVLLNQPVPIAQQRRNVPRTLQFIAERAMANDPAQRFSSAHEMATQLRQWSERHLDRKERVASRASRHQSGDEDVGRTVSSKKGALVLAATVVGLLGLWPMMPSIRTEMAPAAAKANPEDEILFAKPRAAPEPTTEPTAAGAAQVAPANATKADPTPTPRAAEPSAGVQRVVMARDDELSPVTTGTLTTAGGAVVAGASGPSAATSSATASAGGTSIRTVALQDEPVLPGTVEVTPGRGARVAAAPGTGAVRLSVSPWGQIEVNGVLVGLSPPMAQLTLPAGKHVITVRSDGFEPHTAQVWVLSNQSVEFRHRFKP